MNSLRCLFCIHILIFAPISFAQSPSQSAESSAVSQGIEQDLSEEAKFSLWLETLKAEAIVLGISEGVVNSHLDKVQVIPKAVSSDRAQPEFKETYQEYFDKRVSEWRVKQGKLYLEENKLKLQEVAKSYGVQERFIVAILGVESNFGSYSMPHSALDALVTLAYDVRRGERFRKEVFAVLQMIDDKLVDEEQLKSSWAGALGAPQFMPSTFLTFAVDYDGDGKRDIWSAGVDLYASVANYLSHYGWHDNETWARKVMLPEGRIASLEADTKNQVPLDAGCQKYHEHLQGWRNLSAWGELGVKRMNGIDLPARKIPASLIVTHEDFHHGYLVYRNFCSLMRYNPSFKYALSVGILSDEISR